MKQPQSIGPYTLHRTPLRLTEGERVVALSNRQLRVLAMVADAAGKVVARKALTEAIWEGSFVEPSNLTQTVFLIRKALGKLPDGGEYIETVPRSGFRIAPAALRAQGSHTPDPGLDLDQMFALGIPPTAEHYRLLIESIEDYAIYMLDRAGRILTWNPGVETNKGYRAEEVLGKHFSLFFVAEDIEARVPDRELNKAARSGRAGGEGWRLKKNGERFWARFTLTAMRSDSGKLLGFAKVVYDLSERKRQEDAVKRMEVLLRRERDRLHAAAESSMDAFFICEAIRDEQGEIEDFVFTYLNGNVEKLVAIPRERLLRGRMCELLPINRSTGLFERYKSVVVDGKPYVAEHYLEAESLRGNWFRVQAVPLEDGVAITASDITAYKRLAEGIPFVERPN